MHRVTVDIDVLAALPHGSGTRLLELAGRESLLHDKHRVYLDLVTVATVPEDYRDRLLPLFSGVWREIRLFSLEAHDLALSKPERNAERDQRDIAHLAQTGRLNAATLRQRYLQELQPYVIGRQSWHDQTLEMWIDAYFPGEGTEAR